MQLLSFITTNPPDPIIMALTFLKSQNPAKKKIKRLFSQTTD
jgi:hypothetical protein